MSKHALVVDFLAGKDTLTPKFNEISIFGAILDKNFSKAQGRLKSVDQIFKQLNVPLLDTKNIKSLSAQDLIDSLPTTIELLNSLSSETANFNDVLRQSSDLGRLSAQGFDVSKQINELKVLGKEIS